MSEEQSQRPEAPRLCANNCGFFGSPATQNLCSKCHQDLQLQEQQSSAAKLVLNQSQPSTSTPFDDLVEVKDDHRTKGKKEEVVVEEQQREKPQRQEPQQQVKSRCVTCRKRVGLMGFKCRCGLVLCGSHRYPEQHGCEFDFKSMGRDQIAKANPVIKGNKLNKI